jgi:hypothetical protein
MEFIVADVKSWDMELGITDVYGPFKTYIHMEDTHGMYCGKCQELGHGAWENRCLRTLQNLHKYGGHTWNVLRQMSRFGTWSLGEEMSMDPSKPTYIWRTHMECTVANVKSWDMELGRTDVCGPCRLRTHGGKSKIKMKNRMMIMMMMMMMMMMRMKKRRRKRWK